MITSRPRRYNEFTQTSYGVLTLTNPQIAGDAGEYYCTAFWTVSSTDQISSVKAYWSLYGIVLSPAIGIVGSPATMTCSVNAISAPDAISWYRQGNFLPNQPEFKYEVIVVFTFMVRWSVLFCKLWALAFSGQLNI